MKLRTCLAGGGATLALTAALITPSQADTPPYAFGAIGDIPYGSTEIAEFPEKIAAINEHSELSFVTHVGDIKNGSSVCSTSYFAWILAQFDTFAKPLVYTPGDNEWTDCHRTNNGAYNPLERLATLRELFFDGHVGTTLGATTMAVHVDDAAFPENAWWRGGGVTFVDANIPGSNNSLLPWTGLGYTTPTPEQLAEVQARTDADLANLAHAFEVARQNDDRAVVIFEQADMFDPTYTPTWGDISGFQPIVRGLIRMAHKWGKPVYLIDGDSHVYHVDRPLATGSSWLTTYRVSGSADNLTRITVDGSANVHDWVKFTVHPSGDPLSWEQIEYNVP